MEKRLRSLGIILVVVGVVFLAIAGVAYMRVQEGEDALQAFSEAQNVTLSYNEDGQLIDRGTTENAEAIMALLEDEWSYPVNRGDLNPDDPLVNTASEYMFQMATIGYHILHGTQTVVLAEDVEYNGEVFEAGTYEFEVDGRYWTGFDRQHPIEGPARSQAWSGTAHGLFGQLGVGTITHTATQMGLAVSGLFAGIGVFGLIAGLGLIWAVKTKKEDPPRTAPPATDAAPDKEEEALIS